MEWQGRVSTPPFAQTERLSPPLLSGEGRAAGRELAGRRNASWRSPGLLHAGAGPGESRGGVEGVRSILVPFVFLLLYPALTLAQPDLQIAGKIAFISTVRELFFCCNNFLKCVLFNQKGGRHGLVERSFQDVSQFHCPDGRCIHLYDSDRTMERGAVYLWNHARRSMVYGIPVSVEERRKVKWREFGEPI